MDRFADFLKERLYLLNVSPATVTYYQCAFKAWTRYAGQPQDPKQWIVNMRDAGISPVSCNTYICAMNAYWKWAGEPHRLAYLKEEEKVLATLTADHVKRLLHFTPKGRNLQRAHTLTLLLLDTGLRISEALSLTWERVDLDSLVLKVLGKGGKHRVVPFSFECRKLLYRWRQQQHGPYDLVFPTKSGIVTSHRNVGRDVKLLGERAGISGVRFSPHTFRHTFAVSYLRAGGNVLYLQRILGHSSLEMTNRYTRSLGIEDLQAVHSKLSLLSRR